MSSDKQGKWVGRGGGIGGGGGFDEIKIKGLAICKRDPILTNDLPDFTIK